MHIAAMPRRDLLKLRVEDVQAGRRAAGRPAHGDLALPVTVSSGWTPGANAPIAMSSVTPSRAWSCCVDFDAVGVGRRRDSNAPAHAERFALTVTNEGLAMINGSAPLLSATTLAVWVARS
jgi:hypothetical protein